MVRNVKRRTLGVGGGGCHSSSQIISQNYNLLVIVVFSVKPEN